MHWPIFDHFRKPSGSVQYSSLLLDQATSQHAAEDTTPITPIGSLEILSSSISLDISTQPELSDYRTGFAVSTVDKSSSQTSALNTTSTSHTSELQTSELQANEFQNEGHQNYQFQTSDAQENVAHTSEIQMSAPTSVTSAPTSATSGDSIITPNSAIISALSGDSTSSQTSAPTSAPSEVSISAPTSVTQSVPHSVPILISETRISETYSTLQTYQSSTFLPSSSESSILLPTSGYMHSIDSEPEVNHHEKLSKEGKIAVGVIVPLVLIAIGIMLFILYFQRKKKEKEDSFWTSPAYYDFASPYVSQQEKLPANSPSRDSQPSNTLPSNIPLSNTPPSNTPLSNTPLSYSQANRNSVATAHSNF